MSAEPKKKMVALALALMVGPLGAHRFYLGHTGIGVAQLLTAGGCGIWAAVDIIMIALGKMKDAEGNDLV